MKGNPRFFKYLRLTALLTAAWLGWSPALAASTVLGRVLGPAGVTPIPGARVVLYNLVTDSTYTSEPSGPDGGYRIEGLGEGRYDVAVETARGLWLVDRPVTFGADETRQLSFALRERAYWEGADRAPGRRTPLGDNIVGTAVILETEERFPAARGGKRRKLGIGAAIGGGVLGLALLAGDGDGDEASPFAP